MDGALAGRSLLRTKAGSKKHSITSEPSVVMAMIPGCLAAKTLSFPQGDTLDAISSLSAKRA
jgi:hypothetical protein